MTNISFSLVYQIKLPFEGSLLAIRLRTPVCQKDSSLQRSAQKTKKRVRY